MPIYNRGALAVNIDDVICTDLGDQFAYSFELPEIATKTTGATTSVINENSDKGGILHIRLFAASTTNDSLFEKAYNQVRARGGLSFNIVIVSTEGRRLGANGCAIGTQANPEGGGPEQVTMQWSFVFLEYEPDKSLFNS